jgi:hypothetical protein
VPDTTDTDWPGLDVERYCIESGRAVQWIAGDRCLRHGARATPCDTGVRPVQCEHPRRSPNHPTPVCDECGREIPKAVSSG